VRLQETVRVLRSVLQCVAVCCIQIQIARGVIVRLQETKGVLQCELQRVLQVCFSVCCSVCCILRSICAPTENRGCAALCVAVCVAGVLQRVLQCVLHYEEYLCDTRK